MLATAKPPDCAGRNLGIPSGATAGAITTPKALTIRMGGDDLTNLAWLQKSGVLNSMCTALTGSPHRVSKAGTRAVRRASGRAQGSGDSRKKNSDKMVNVILNVRNRKYNGEDAQKPPLSFACMIFMAVESSPTKTLPVKEIYEWIMWKFPFYRAAGPGWKNSVRHNLSLNKCFKKVDRSSSKVRQRASLFTSGMMNVLNLWLAIRLCMTVNNKFIFPCCLKQSLLLSAVKVTLEQGRAMDSGCRIPTQPSGGPASLSLPSIPQLLLSTSLPEVSSHSFFLLWPGGLVFA